MLDDRLRADTRCCAVVSQKVVPLLPIMPEYAYHALESYLAYTTTELADPWLQTLLSRILWSYSII